MPSDYEESLIPVVQFRPFVPAQCLRMNTRFLDRRFRHLSRRYLFKSPRLARLAYMSCGRLQEEQQRKSIGIMSGLF